MDVVIELLIVWGWEWGELLVRVGREMVGVLRTGSHKGGAVRIVRPDQIC